MAAADEMIVYYRGLWSEFYSYPLNQLRPGAYYLRIKPYVANILIIDIPEILPIYMTGDLFEKEFITP